MAIVPSEIVTPPPNSERGLYGKYEVHKLRRTVRRFEGSSGTVTTIERVDPGPVFVLAYTTDPHAAVALAAYAKSCETDYPKLAADLREQLRGQPECECDEPACQWCEIHGETGNREDHDFVPVEGHPDDDECTHRADGTDATYCGLPEREH